MKLKRIVDECFGDYKEVAMLLVTPNCTWKCEGCQNRHLSQLPTEIFPDEEILKRFLKNPLTSAIVIGGLEPLDTITDLICFFNTLLYSKSFKKQSRPPIIIFTGYELDELNGINGFDALAYLGKIYGNCYLKYGRYIPNQEKTWNEILGIYLASPNQQVIKF